MKANLDDIKDSFKVGYEAYEESMKEAREIWDLYHNRHFTIDQLAILANRGQPAETFNVVKMFARMLLGYYSTVVNQVTVLPTNPRDLDTAATLNDVIDSIFEDNRMDIEGDSIKLAGMISGLLCAKVDVQDTGDRDQFNRPINRVDLGHVKDSELVPDPMSVKDDYSDARYLHRYRWVTAEAIHRTFGKEWLEKLDSQDNFLDIDEADFEYNYGHEPFTGHYKVFDNYLIVHTVMEDDNGERWSVFWSGDHKIRKEKITYKKCRWPYRLQKLHASDKTEYYGIFREVKESQHAINQAVIKIQLMVNSEKAFVEEGAVKNMSEFTDAYNRVTAVIPVLSLQGVKIENMTAEISEQYQIIDNALGRIKQVLGINDSFLGMAMASDSGRKVKLQQNQSIMSLRYMTARIEAFYKSLGMDVAHLVEQYYYANQIMMVTDEIVGARWFEVNKPMSIPTGQVDPFTGEEIMEPILLPLMDPATQEEAVDEDGNIILAPVAEAGTDFSFFSYQIRVVANAYNDEDEKAQLLLETALNGQTGAMMSSVNPAGYLQLAALNIRSLKTKYSPEIVKVIEQTAQMLAQNPAANAEAALRMSGGNGGSNPMSSQLKLPQNTNEGL